MRRLLTVVFLLPALTIGASPDFRSDRYLSDVRALSSPAMSGRGTGGAGLEKAAAFIARRFAKAGLRSLTPHSFYQPFSVSYRATMGKSSVWFNTSTEQQVLKEEEFLPLGFSGEGVASGPVVFAGYGITAPEYGYDDYKGIDARGKVVLILRHEPQEYDSSSVFEGRIYSQHSQWIDKCWNARAHGASALLVVSDSINHANDIFEPFVSLVGPASAGIPVVQIKEAVAMPWFVGSGKDLRSIQQEIDRSLEPQSFALPTVAHLKVVVSQESRMVNNIAGYLPGESDRYIIVGAHYDHLGFGEQYSLAPEQSGALHPGADDNASGVAGVLALARWFAAQPKRPYGILFLAFAGEELGLLGSSHYVTNPLLPLAKAELMINMDMIGRIREHKVMVTGAPEGSGQRGILQRLGSRAGLNLLLDDGGIYGSSDHTSFKAHSVPILFFFSGIHADYHKPGDTWNKIDPVETVKLLQVIGGIPNEMAAGRMTRTTAIFSKKIEETPGMTDK